MQLSRFPLVVLAAAMTVLAVPIAIGSWTARLVAGSALLVAVGLLASFVAYARREHPDEPVLDVVARGLVHEWAWMLGMTISHTALIVWLLGPGSGSRDDSSWLGPVAGVVMGGAVVAGLILSVRALRRREGVERLDLVESTSIAFFVTVLASVVYAVFESVADAPRLSMWVVWGVGMGTWFAASVVRSWRTS